MTITKTMLRGAMAVTVMAGALTLAPVADADNSGHGQSGMHGSGQGMMQGGMSPEQMRQMMQNMSPEQRRALMQSMRGQGARMMGRQSGSGMMGHGMMGSRPMGPGAMGQQGMMQGPMMGHGMMGGMGMMGSPMMSGMDVMGPMDPGMIRQLGEEKRTELQKMRQEMRRTQMEAMLDMMSVRDEMHEAMLAEQPDPARIRELHDRMAERHGEALEARIEMRNQMRDLVDTNDQK